MKPYIKVILCSFLIIFACLGFGRFAFGMVLPNIQYSLGISTTQAGFIGTANFIGYFVGIIFANYFYSKFETYKLIFVTLILQSLSMLLMIYTLDYLIISVFYTFSGFFAAIANISIMAYMANIIPKNIRGKVLGLVVSGSGLAIIISGILVPYIEENVQELPWRMSWLIFSILIVLVAIVSSLGIKKHTKHTIDKRKTNVSKYLTLSTFWKIASIYMIFGITYVVYVTFFVSAVIDKYNVSSSISGDFWALLGFMSIFSGFLFGTIADKIGPYKALTFVYILQTLAHLILTINVSSNFMWISAILFGISIWSIPSLITVLASIHFDKTKTAQVLSLLTLLFAFCQAIAPVAAGFIFDMSKDFSYVFMGTSVLTFLAIMLSYAFSKQPIK